MIVLAILESRVGCSSQKFLCFIGHSIRLIFPTLRAADTGGPGRAGVKPYKSKDGTSKELYFVAKVMAILPFHFEP